MLILQNYTHSLSKLLEGDVSLHPITSAIQELEDAAKQVEEEMKVFIQKPVLVKNGFLGTFRQF